MYKGYNCRLLCFFIPFCHSDKGGTVGICWPQNQLLVPLDWSLISKTQHLFPMKPGVRCRGWDLLMSLGRILNTQIYRERPAWNWNVQNTVTFTVFHLTHFSSMLPNSIHCHFLSAWFYSRNSNQYHVIVNCTILSAKWHLLYGAPFVK